MTGLSDDRMGETAGGEERASADDKLDGAVKVKKELFAETEEVQSVGSARRAQNVSIREMPSNANASNTANTANTVNAASAASAAKTTDAADMVNVTDVAGAVNASDINGAAGAAYDIADRLYNADRTAEIVETAENAENAENAESAKNAETAKTDSAGDNSKAGTADSILTQDGTETKAGDLNERNPQISSNDGLDEDRGDEADNKVKSNSGRVKSSLLKMTLCAVFIGLAVVAKLFLSIKIPLLGADGLRISLAGVFTAFPAFICGPIYGGIASAASDFIGYIIKPDGAYIPWLTLTAFAGGVLKGIIWRLFVRRPRKSVRILALAAFVIVGSLGLIVHISLISDGILNDITASQSQLATRGRMESLEKNAVSGAVVNLAKYNNDVFTVTAVSDSETIVMPSKANLDGYERPVTKIGGGAFSSCGSAKSIYIPSVYTSIDNEAFTGIDISGLVIISEKNSAAEKFASQNGISFEEGTVEEFTLELVSVYSDGGYSVSALQSGGFTIKSSDAYRKNLSGYISFTTVGLELIGLIGILYFVLEAAISRYEASRTESKDKNGKQKKKILGHIVNPQLVKIMLSTVISGLIVTTVNTKILQAVLAVYSGRSFIILWIPRFIEELAVCMVQSVLISVLYGIYISTVGKKTQRILDGKGN